MAGPTDHIPPLSDASPKPQVIREVCAVPFRRGAEGVSFCLITSLKRQHWILPKGIIDPGETAEQSALKEAFEEAGLRGRIVGEPLGSYNDAKWGATLDVAVLLMEVESCEDSWPESDQRRRCWASPSEAPELVARPELRQMLRRATARISGEKRDVD